MTMPPTFVVNENYAKVVRGVLEIHRFDAGGQWDAPEADAIRDATDGPWNALSDTERKRVGGLSEDLSDMMESTASEPPLPMNPQAQGKLNQAYEARERGEWD